MSRSYDDLNERQQAIVSWVCARARKQEAADEAVGVLVDDLVKEFKLTKNVMRMAMKSLITHGFVLKRKTSGMVKAPFMGGGYHEQKLVVYKPGPNSPGGVV